MMVKQLIELVMKSLLLYKQKRGYVDMKTLNIYQVGELLTLEFDQTIDNIKNVYVKNEFDEVSFEQTEIKNKFVINLFEILNVFDKYDRETIFFLLEKTDGITQSIQKVNVKKYDYEIYNFETVVNEEATLTPYLTKNGVLQFTKKPQLPLSTYFARRHIDKVTINNKRAFIKGKFSLQNSTLKEAKLLITSRLSENVIEVPLNTTVFNVYKSLNSISYDFEVDIINDLKQFLLNDFDSEDIIDLFLEIKVQEFRESIDVKLGIPRILVEIYYKVDIYIEIIDKLKKLLHKDYDSEDIIYLFLEIKVQEFRESIDFKLGNPRILVERLSKGEISIEQNDKIKTAVPYFTMKGRNLSFRINEYD